MEPNLENYRPHVIGLLAMARPGVQIGPTEPFKGFCQALPYIFLKNALMQR